MNTRKLLLVWLLRIISLTIIVVGIIHIWYSIINLIDFDYPIWATFIVSFQIIVEIIVFVQSPLLIMTIIDAMYEEENQLNLKVPDEYPTLDVYIPIRYVDISILRKTLEAMVSQDYPTEKMTIFVCDDTPDQDISNSYKELTEELGVEYIYEPTNVKYKSGMLNLSLPRGNAEYIAFFDYDQVPMEGILKKLSHALVAHPDRPFVQAKKKFRDLYNYSRIWSALLYVIFFELILLTKRRLRTVVFAGSTAMFRRKDIDDVGGIPEETFTEDNELSTRMLVNGKHGLFLDEYGSLGTVPTGYRAQISQLWRWSHGGAHVFHKEKMNVIKADNLSLSQKVDTLSLLLITPSLVAYYFYILTFIPLFLFDINSARLEVFGVSSLVIVPLIPGITYLLLASAALKKGKENEMDFKIYQLPLYLTIALAANLLILGSGVAGVLGKMGPKSKRGKWTRKIRVLTWSTLATVLGIVLVYISFMWLISGLSAAVIILLMSLTLIPTLPISAYYVNTDNQQASKKQLTSN